MAEAEGNAIKTIKLQVAAARQEESGQGIARLPRTAMSALGVTEGDVVAIGVVAPTTTASNAPRSLLGSPFGGPPRR